MNEEQKAILTEAITRLERSDSAMFDRFAAADGLRELFAGQVAALATVEPLTDEQIELPELPKPWRYACSNEGRIEFSAGPERPYSNERHSGYVTPWAGMHDGFSMQNYARATIRLNATPPTSKTDTGEAIRNAALEDIAIHFSSNPRKFYWGSAVVDEIRKFKSVAVPIIQEQDDATCEKCSQHWADHDFDVPEPSCPSVINAGQTGDKS